MDTSSMPLCCRVDLDDVVADIMQKNKGIVGVDAVLVGAQHIAVMDLACHPYIRSSARKLYEEYATVTTTPTDLGEKVPSVSEEQTIDLLLRYWIHSICMVQLSDW